MVFNQITIVLRCVSPNVLNINRTNSVLRFLARSDIFVYTYIYIYIHTNIDNTYIKVQESKSRIAGWLIQITNLIKYNIYIYILHRQTTNQNTSSGQARWRCR